MRKCDAVRVTFSKQINFPPFYHQVYPADLFSIILSSSIFSKTMPCPPIPPLISVRHTPCQGLRCRLALALLSSAPSLPFATRLLPNNICSRPHSDQSELSTLMPAARLHLALSQSRLCASTCEVAKSKIQAGVSESIVAAIRETLKERGPSGLCAGLSARVPRLFLSQVHCNFLLSACSIRSVCLQCAAAN